MDPISPRKSNPIYNEIPRREREYQTSIEKIQ